MPDQSSRKYEPSDLKLAHLRQMGVRPLVTALPAVLGLVFAAFAMAASWPVLVEAFGAYFAKLLSGRVGDEVTTAALMTRALWLVAVAVLPVGVGSLAGWMLGNVVQAGFGTQGAGMAKPSGNRYSVPRRRAVDGALRGLLAVALVGIGAICILRVLAIAVALEPEQLHQPAVLARMLARPVLFTFLPAVAGLIVIDIVATRYWFIKSARMTEIEKRREVQDQEVGWLTRVRRRMSQDGGRR